MNLRHPRLLALSLIAVATLGTVGTLLLTAGAEVAPIADAASRNDVPVAATTERTADTDRQVVTQPRGCYAAAAGSTFAFDLTGKFDYAVRHPEGGAQRSGMQLHAELQMAVLDRKEQEILLRVALTDVALSALAGTQGRDEGGLAEAAARPFDVRLGEDGRVLGYHFANGMTGEQRNFVRGVFAALLHTVPVAPVPAWEAEDDDAAGTFLARWRLATAEGRTQVERQKVRYTAMAGDDLHPHTIAGGSHASFDADIRWLTSVDVDERIALTIPDLGMTIELHTVLHAALTAHGRGAPTATADAWSTATAPAAGHGEDLTSAQEAAEQSRWRQQLEGVTVDAITAELAALLAAEPQDPQAIDRAWQALIWRIRLDPEVAASIPARVAGMPERLADMLISALGAAGTDAAQDVLLALRGDAAATPALRTSATVAMFQVARPATRVFAALSRDVDGAAEFTGDTAMGMLLLGALAPRSNDAAASGGSAFATLLALESRSAEQGRQDLWLNALGNAATPAIVPHVERYLGHDDERVRAAAAHALRRVDSAPARALLDRALADPSATVRADAVHALGEHRADAARDTLIRVAAEDAEPSVRRATLDGLAGFARANAAARAAIERMARADRDPDNQRAAQTTLEGLR